jgi:ribosomal protein S18 acetylase RimI-like enzyme
MTPSLAIAFRAATPADAALVRELVRAAYAKWVPVIGREPRPMTADYDRALREHEIEFLSADGEIAGLIETMLQPDHLWIENVAVRPERQGQGIGRRLLAHAERKAAAAGHAELRLLTNAAFTTNVTLYSRLGYRVERTEEWAGGLTLHMRKTL